MFERLVGDVAFVRGRRINLQGDILVCFQYMLGFPKMYNRGCRRKSDFEIMQAEV